MALWLTLTTIGTLIATNIGAIIGWWKSVDNTVKTPANHPWSLHIAAGRNVVNRDRWGFDEKIDLNESVAVRLCSGDSRVVIGWAKVTDDDFDEQLAHLKAQAKAKLAILKAAS